MKHVPAPVGGLNIRDSIANMPPEDAVILTNMFCLPDKVMLRKGHIAHATGLDSQVNGIYDYNSYTSSTIFASTTANIYNVTTAGARGASFGAKSARAAVRPLDWQATHRLRARRAASPWLAVFRFTHCVLPPCVRRT